MDLSKTELVSKLEEISLLHKKALVVKNKMNNYQPEDNYVREIIVPQFPGDLDDDDKEYLETGINHKDEDAIEEVMESYDDYSAPRKPVEPKFESFREPCVETKSIGCLMFGGLFAVAIALGSLLVGDLDSISKTACLCVLAVGAIITVISIIKGIANKSKKAYAKSKALSAYNQNKEKAMKILRSRVYDMAISAQNAEISEERKNQVGTGDRSERIRTYNFPQGRVTDHRIGLTLHKLDMVLNGDLNEVIEALITADQSEKLKMSE